MNDDALQAALIERARREQARRNQPAPEPEQEPGFFKRTLGKVQDFSEGIGVSGLETYYGLKDLVGKGEPSDRATLEAWRRASAESGWGAAGKMTGDIAQYALPGGAIGKAGKIGPLVADVTATTAVDLAKLPEYGESRMHNAQQGAMLGMGGHVLGKTLGTVAMGVKGTPAAERLRELGGKLTPGQMKEGLLRKAEHWTEAAIPFASKAVREAEKRSKETVGKALLQKAAPPTPASLFSGKPVPAKVESLAELNKAYDDAYQAAWSTVDDVSIDTLEQSAKMAVGKIAIKKDQKAFANVIDQMVDVLGTRGKSASEVDALLRKHMRPHKGGKNRVWNEAMSDLRTGLHESMPEANRDALRLVNSKYGEREALGYAATSAAGVRGKLMGPESLTTGVKRSSTERALEEGRGNLQQELQDWSEVIGDPAGVIPLLKRRLIQGAPSGGIMQYPADLVAGNYGYQAAARKAMNKPVPRMLRRTLSPYRAGAASKDLIDEEEDY